MGNPADLKPGSMISVQLMAGDLSVGADGTVTHIDGNRIYAFGHRFLDIGATALPFARAEVLTLLANTNTSFKISSAQGMDGHHLPGPQHRRRRRTGQAARDGARSRLPSRAPASTSTPTRCRWSTTRCFPRCWCRWRSSPRSTPPSAPWAPPASGSPARSNFRTRRPCCASIICSPPITAPPCRSRSPPPSPWPT